MAQLIQIVYDGEVMAEAALPKVRTTLIPPLVVAGQQLDDGPAATPWEIMPGDKLTIHVLDL